MSDPSKLAAHLPSPERLALFLDIDGTLIGPTLEARAVGIAPPRIALLGRLRDALGGAAAILSGRSIESVDRMLAPLALAVGGLQGADRRFADGRRVLPVQTAEERRALDRVADAIASRYPDVELEWKPGALALVFSGEKPESMAATALAAHHAGDDVKVIVGATAVDIVPLSASKGAALAAFMAGAPFLGRVPVHVGDDLPDEPAFHAAREGGGFGVAVGRHVGGIDRLLADSEETWTMLDAYADKWAI